VVRQYDGALKGEHGTGRNIAPFVETEWGPEAYAIMRRLKELVDPHGLLNPCVILNPDPKAHLADLKSLPGVEDEVDKCIECGYCESKCPSQDLTLTPRQRIVVRREMVRLRDGGDNGNDREAQGTGYCFGRWRPTSLHGARHVRRGRAVRHRVPRLHQHRGPDEAIPSAATSGVGSESRRVLATQFAILEPAMRVGLWMGHAAQSFSAPQPWPGSRGPSGR